MKQLILIATLCISTCTTAQIESYEDSIRSERVKQFAELTDTAQHILNTEEIDNLVSLDFFKINLMYKVTAKFTLDKGKKFKMPTTTERQPEYRRYGYLDFELKGKSLRLAVYQNMELKRKKEFKNHLFLPFRDASSGNESYGGGRFLDLTIPDGNTISVDFNRCYNPYCVYSHRFSCPIPPVENTLSISIEAGEKLPQTNH